MTARRPFLLVVFAMALASAGLGSAPVLANESTCDPESQLAVIPACGTMILSGAQSGFVRVSIPEGTELRMSDITIEGDGVLPGVVLTPDPPYLTAPDCGLTDDGQQIQRCAHPERGPAIRVLLPEEFGVPRRASMVAPQDCMTAVCVLKERTYRLYLLTGGSPATVTVRLSGLDGVMELQPGTLVQADARVPDPVALPSGSSLYSAGFTGTLASPGLSFGASAVRHVASAANVTGICNYLSDPGDSRIAYQPGCPGSATAIHQPITAILPISFQGTGSNGFAYPLSPGPVGIGGYSVVAGAASSNAFAGLTLSFDA